MAKHPIDLAVSSAKPVQLTHRTPKVRLSVGTTTVEKSFYILPLPHFDIIIGMPFFKENNIDLSNVDIGDIAINDYHIPLRGKDCHEEKGPQIAMLSRGDLKQAIWQDQIEESYLMMTKVVKDPEKK